MKSEKRVLHIALCLIMLFLAVSCGESEIIPGSDVPGPSPLPPDTTVVASPESRTMIVYMVANNNLGQLGYDAADIAEMCEGMRHLAVDSARRLLVYHAPGGGVAPALKEIDTEGNVTELKQYADANLSVSIARMREVMTDMRTFAPAQSYGAVFWSHGTGWLAEASAYVDPDMPDEEENAAPLSFGLDSGNRRMSIPALAASLADVEFDFIYFDCCLMGTVEVAYELRNVTREIVAVATELPLEGMPYDVNVPLLLRISPSDAADAAAQTYQYYRSPEASNNYLAIAVYNTAALDELADVTQSIMATGALPADGYQGIPYFRSSVVATGAYDMGHFIRSLSLDEQLLREWNEAYAAVVSYHAATPVSYGLDMSGFTGMGCNIATSPTDPRLGYGYRQLQWWKDVVSHNPKLN